MAELCKKCFIETWHPNAYDIEHIVMSDENEFCEGCLDCVPYVDYIDTSELRRVRTSDDLYQVVKTHVMLMGDKIACPECGAIFEDDDIAYTHETGLCQYCHKVVDDLWVKQ